MAPIGLPTAFLAQAGRPASRAGKIARSMAGADAGQLNHVPRTTHRVLLTETHHKPIHPPPPPKPPRSAGLAGQPADTETLPTFVPANKLRDLTRLRCFRLSKQEHDACLPVTGGLDEAQGEQPEIFTNFYPATETLSPAHDLPEDAVAVTHGPGRYANTLYG